MTWLWFLLAAVAIAVILVATSRLPRPRRWRCECGAQFHGERELVEHVTRLHGRCRSSNHSHRCVLLDGHAGTHLCGCELRWTR